MTAVPLLEHSPPEDSLYDKHRQPAVRSSTRGKQWKKQRAEDASRSDYTQSTVAVKGNNLIKNHALLCYTVICFDLLGLCLIKFAELRSDCGRWSGSSARSLTLAAHLFHLCSHGSRDARRGTEPWLEGAYALRQRLSPGDQVYEALRLSESAQGSFRSKT
jgi:hypothetical protein